MVVQLHDNAVNLNRAVCGESAAVSDESVEHWKEEVLSPILEGFESGDVYNVDETGLFYQLMPTKTVSVKGEAYHKGRMSKQRITVLLCSNADGSDKLDPTVIGKFHKPHCFKNSATLPCTYYRSKSAWITVDLFIKFLQASDARMGARNRKVVLFMDKCPAHPTNLGFLQNVKVHFFLAHCTSRLQPMVLGIIHSLKSKYQKAFVLKALVFIDRNEVLKLSILQAMHLLTGAWKMSTKETISNCFHKVGFNVMSSHDKDGDESSSGHA
ncbi:tigger transposable element-derived protein 6-like [Schistocerca gregaria]|uniref:tigger transposable element-derived protein 6-like n=1 Tax=Schistocerca gregaria TaxID=7010 RepID=UPI00211DED4D|nr:tigger transposable element-derived protein 6-like [Schistocerca gregaria]